MCVCVYTVAEGMLLLVSLQFLIAFHAHDLKAFGFHLDFGFFLFL